MFLPAIDEEATELFDYPQLTGTPERRLLLAILERAMLDYVGNDSAEVNAAESWLFCEESSTCDEFTFPWLCQQLDLDQKHVSSLIRKMPRRGNQRVAPWYFSRQSAKQAKGRAVK